MKNQRHDCTYTDLKDCGDLRRMTIHIPNSHRASSRQRPLCRSNSHLVQGYRRSATTVSNSSYFLGYHRIVDCQLLEIDMAPGRLDSSGVMATSANSMPEIRTASDHRRQAQSSYRYADEQLFTISYFLLQPFIHLASHAS
jgi:hypothetical protein